MGDMADMCLESAGSGWEEAWCRDDEPSRSLKLFVKDDLFYHKHYKGIKRIYETDKAVLFENKKGQFWCPKKLIRYDYYIWKGFKPKYIEIKETKPVQLEECYQVEKEEHYQDLSNEQFEKN